MLPNTPFFKFLYGTLLISLIIWVFEKISFIFNPMMVLFETLLIPFLIAGVLYYLLRPIVNWLVKKGISKTNSILMLFSTIISTLTITFYFVGPILNKQLNHLLSNIPFFIEKIEKTLINIKSYKMVQEFHLIEKLQTDEVTDYAMKKITNSLTYIGNNFIDILSTVTGTLLILIVVPFILFYLLKDGDKLTKNLLKVIPTNHKNEAKEILKDMDFALSSYIQGQVLVSIFVGCFVYIGYLIIGLDYSLVLALIATVTNIIPFLGPFLGLLPALIVGIFDSWTMAIYVILVVLIVQQIESNLISPQIMGKRLSIHPLTIILILLFAGRFAGALGLLIAVPVYAVSKVIITHLFHLTKLKSKQRQKKENPFNDE